MDREPVGQHFDGAWEVFKNQSSEEIPAHAVMRTESVTSWDNRIILEATKPNTYGSYWSHRINGPTAVAAGRYGLCRLGGIAAALYDAADGTPNAGDLWGPRSGSWKLRKDTPGWRIVGNTISPITFVIHQPQQTVVGKTDAAHNKATTGTVSVYWSSSGGSLTDTNQDLTAYNRYGNVGANKFVTLNWNGWGWEIIAAECG